MDADMGDSFTYYWETQRYLESEELVDRYAPPAANRPSIAIALLTGERDEG